MAAKDREARSGVTKEFTNSCPIRGVGQRWSIVEKMGIQMLVSDDTMMAVHPYRGDMHGLYVQDSGKTLLLDPITAFGGEEELARAYFEENFKVLNFCEKLTEGHPRRLPEVLKKAWDRDELKLRTYYQDYVRNVMGNGPPEHKPA